MRLQTPSLLPLLLLTSLTAALPSINKYEHYIDPDCPGIGSQNCKDIGWCHYHHQHGDLLTHPTNSFLRTHDADIMVDDDVELMRAVADAAESAVHEPAVRFGGDSAKQSNRPQAVACGTLVGDFTRGSDICNPFSLVAGTVYDLRIDHPITSDESTNNPISSPPPFSQPPSSFTNPPHKGTLVIFANVLLSGLTRHRRIATAPTGLGSRILTFTAERDAVSYQIALVGSVDRPVEVDFYVLGAEGRGQAQVVVGR